MPSSSFIQQPSFWVKVAGVTSPEFFGCVDGDDGDAHESSLGDEDTVDEPARCGADGVSKWERVVNIDLRAWKSYERECKAQFLTSLVSSATAGCILSNSDVNASR